MLRRISPFPSHRSSGPAESSSSRSSEGVSESPSARKRCSTPGSRYFRANAPEPALSREPTPCRISSAIAHARTRAEISTTASTAPTADLLLLQTRSAACRNSNATTNPRPHNLAPSHLRFPAPPFANTARASGRQLHASRSTPSSTRPLPCSPPSACRPRLHRGTSPFLRPGTTFPSHSPRQATPRFVQVLSAPSGRPARETLSPIPTVAACAPIPARASMRQSGALLSHTSRSQYSVPRLRPPQSAQYLQ